MRYIAFLFIWIASCNLTVNAQQEEVPVDSDAVVTNSFWDNWYGQVGVDMNLMFPYGHSVKDVFPNGKSFGVKDFIKVNKRNPSKHDEEERGKYLNWIKANRKALNAGKMKPERVEKFRKLLALTEQYRRKNQYE